ncbi:MAG: hypothetical protein IJO63_05385 [Bacilli bacterium]|nr:hypothetical protein [Bacilli bacterium]
MKDIIKYISILGLIVFSFYYTDKISTMIIYKSDLMKEIMSHKQDEEILAVSAVISGNYIIPGINGLKINELDSYYQMKKAYTYSSSKLVFDEVEPNTSLETNKHLIIKRGNKEKKGVSIIINDNDSIARYAIEQNISVDTLITYDDFNKDAVIEQINNDKNMDKLDILLDKYKLNTNICLVNKDNKQDCINDKKYLIEPSYYVDNMSIIGIEVNSGDIFYIGEDLSLANFKVLIKKIYYRDLDIIYLSKLISEKRDIQK